jgi:hypothetical protein
MTMHVFSVGIQKTVVSLAGATAFLVPLAAAAQPFADEHIRGTISSYERNDGEVRRHARLAERDAARIGDAGRDHRLQRRQVVRRRFDRGDRSR